MKDIISFSLIVRLLFFQQNRHSKDRSPFEVIRPRLTIHLGFINNFNLCVCVFFPLSSTIYLIILL